MNDLANYLLTLVLIYGYPLIGSIVLAGGLGLPMPVSTILVAAGSFTSSTDTTLNLYTLIAIVTIAAITGDSLGYYIGRKFGPAIAKRYTKKNGITSSRINHTHAFLNRWGVWCILITRILITPLGVPVNLVAGTQKYPFKTFFMVALLGEFLWATMYISIGHYFGASWVTIYEYINNTPQIAALVFVGVILLVVSIKFWPKKKLV